MLIENGSRVRVVDGAQHWYGVVTGRSDTDIQVRIGGSERVVPVARDRIRPHFPTADEVLTEATKAHRLLLLGCPHHGDSAADTLIGESPKGNARFSVIFMEGFPYDETHGIPQSFTNGAPTERYHKEKLKTLAKLRSICGKVIGLETDETAPKLPEHLLTKFCQEARCTVANAAWARIIEKNLPEHGTAVACVGTAHLVRMQEKSLAEPLQAVLKADLRIPAYAVTHHETGMYKPEGSLSGYLPNIVPFDKYDKTNGKVVHEFDPESASASDSDSGSSSD